MRGIQAPLAFNNSSYILSHCIDERCLALNSTSLAACRQSFVSRYGLWLDHQLDSFTPSGLHTCRPSQVAEISASAVTILASSAKAHHLFCKHAENLEPCYSQHTRLASPARGHCFLCSTLREDGNPSEDVDTLHIIVTRCQMCSSLATMKLWFRTRTSRSIGIQRTISSSSIQKYGRWSRTNF